MWKFFSLLVLLICLVLFNTLVILINRYLRKKDYKLTPKMYYVLPSIGMLLLGLFVGKFIVGYLL